MTEAREKATVASELREALQRAASLVDELGRLQTDEPEAAPAPELESQLEHYRSELEAVRTDRDLLTEQMISVERQAGRIMSLYVATHQLHATLKVEDVYAAIGEIAQDLLGAESFAVLVQDDEESGWKVGLARGIDPSAVPLLKGGRYPGGIALIDETLGDGVLRIHEEDDAPVIAAVPLRVESGILGVLAVLRVFGHKADSLQKDRDLLELLSAHVGSALLAAESYSTADRRLRTLKDLVGLLPGS